MDQQQTQNLLNLGFTQVQINQLRNTYRLDYPYILDIYSQTLRHILSNNNIPDQPILDQLLRGENIRDIIQNGQINISDQTLNDINNSNGNEYIAYRTMNNIIAYYEVRRILEDYDSDSDMDGGKKRKSRKSRKSRRSIRRSIRRPRKSIKRSHR